MAKVSLTKQGPTHPQIAHRAFEIYVSRGGDHGQDMGDWFEAEREDIVTLVYKCLKGCSSNDADQGGHTSGERDGVHLLGERKRVIGIHREGICRIL